MNMNISRAQNNINSWNGEHKENVSDVEFCLCSVYPKESLGCNIVKPWPPQGLVSTLRCPRCEACVQLFIRLVTYMSTAVEENIAPDFHIIPQNLVVVVGRVKLKSRSCMGFGSGSSSVHMNHTETQ